MYKQIGCFKELCNYKESLIRTLEVNSPLNPKEILPIHMVHKNPMEWPTRDTISLSQVAPCNWSGPFLGHVPKHSIIKTTSMSLFHTKCPSSFKNMVRSGHVIVLTTWNLSSLYIKHRMMTSSSNSSRNSNSQSSTCPLNAKWAKEMSMW